MSYYRKTYLFVMIDFLKEQIHQILDLVFLKVEQQMLEPKDLVGPWLQLMRIVITKGQQGLHLKIKFNILYIS